MKKIQNGFDFLITSYGFVCVKNSNQTICFYNEILIDMNISIYQFRNVM